MWRGRGVQGPMLGADLGCCLQREGLEALYCPPVPHTSYPLSCVSPLIYPCPRVSWPLATAAAAPMDRPGTQPLTPTAWPEPGTSASVPPSGTPQAWTSASAGAMHTSQSSARTKLRHIPYDQPLKMAALLPSVHPLLDQTLLPPHPIT